MDALEQILQIERIRDVIHQYCRAIDERRFDDVLKAFASDASIEHGSYKGPASKFVGFLTDVLPRMEFTLHTLGGIIVTFDGAERATSHATFTSFHRINGEHDKVGPIETGGVDTDWIVAGRYCDTLQLIDDEWKIIERHGHNDWTRGVPANPS